MRGTVLAAVQERADRYHMRTYLRSHARFLDGYALLRSAFHGRSLGAPIPNGKVSSI
jgi:hypothetical protein